MKNWHPDIDLDRLLTALGEEIIDSPDGDVLTLCGQVGTPSSGIARDMRARIRAVSIVEAERAPTLVETVHRREVRSRFH